MVSPVEDMANPVDPDFQQQLSELARAANIQIDPKLFSVILDLLRNGVSPDSIYAFLVKASRLSKLGLRIREKEEKEEREKTKGSPLPHEDAGKES